MKDIAVCVLLLHLQTVSFSNSRDGRVTAGAPTWEDGTQYCLFKINIYKNVAS